MLPLDFLANSENVDRFLNWPGPVVNKKMSTEI